MRTVNGVESSPNVFRTPLNLVVVSVSAPGSGKSNAFSKVVETLSDYTNRHNGKNIHLETYTNAGLQSHQQENEGYAILTSDEGGRLLSSINYKQSKGESEKALLCKMWGGHGDRTTLLNGERGFKSTFLSVLCYVQPYPLLTEFSASGMAADDGFIDRLLFAIQKPTLHKLATIKQSTEILSQRRMKNFTNVFKIIDEIHRDDIPRTYHLSPAARDIFEEYVDSFVTFMDGNLRQ
jgi:hypothetical protein